MTAALLDNIIGIREVHGEDGVVKQRGALDFRGAAMVEDDPSTGRTKITIVGVVGVLVTDLFTRQGNSEGEPIVAKQYSLSNTRGGGLFYWASAPGRAHDGAIVIGTIGTGRWIRIVSGTVDATWFGALGNGIADDSQAIQSAVDYAIANNIGEVLLPAGVYKTTRTIHLCKSGTFSSIKLRGGGCYKYRGQSLFGGAAISAQHTNSPAVNAQGQRGGVIRDLTILGTLAAHIDANNLAHASSGNSTNPNDVDESAWTDPAAAATSESRYAPHAGIVIDGWAGTAPATAYPTTYLSYGQSFSQDVLIENVNVYGFNTCVVVQPCDADGNGDYVNIHSCFFQKFKWGISVGNTQSRNVSIRDVKMQYGFCALTNNQHGKQNGKFQGTISDLSTTLVIQRYKFTNTATLGPLKETSGYAESMWRLGDITSNTTAETPINIDCGQFGYHLQSAADGARGIPATALGAAPFEQASITFTDCIHWQYPSCLVFAQNGVRFERTMMRPASRDGTVSKAYLALFHNATCGGAIFPGLNSPRGHQIKFVQSNLENSLSMTSNATIAEDGMRNSQRAFCIPAWVRAVGTRSDETTEFVQVQRFSIAKAKNGSVITELALAQDGSKPGELTFKYTTLTDAFAGLNGLEPGDVIYDDQSYSVFVIRSRDVDPGDPGGTPARIITAELQNNYKKSDGVFSCLTAFSLTVGNLYFLNSRLYTPNYPLFADLTSASATLSNVGRADAFAAFIDTPANIDVGDRVYVQPTLDNWVSSSTSKITALDGTGRTITLDGNATRTEARRRLSIMVRKPPVNDGSR
jgi:hypothetical protein